MTQQSTTHNNPSSISDDEIDLMTLLKPFWEGRKTIIKTTLIFMVVGLFIAIFSPKEFTASTTIVPVTEGKSIGGNFGGLAALAGINTSGGSESGISPALYPQITSSIPFQKELLLTPLTFEGQKEQITYQDYYTKYSKPGVLGIIKKYTIGLPGLLISALKGKSSSVKTPELSEGSSLLTITKEENDLIKQLAGQIVLDVNKKEDYVSVSANMPEALPAAEMAQKAQVLLQKYIINFKIKKSAEQLKFIEDRFTEKEREFKTIQQKLARFKDQNKFINSELAQINLMRLQSEYELTYGVYMELAKQLESQQLQVKEDTPVFTILKPVLVPLEKSKPQKAIILIIWTFLGGIVGIGIVFRNVFLSYLKDRNKEEVEVLVNIEK